MPKHAKPTDNQTGIPVSQDHYVPDTSSYQEYKQFTRSAWQPVNVSRKKKMGIGKKIGITFAALLVLVLAGVGAYIWQLDSALSIAPEDSSKLREQLSDRNANEPFYVLVLGSDKRETKNTNVERADVTMLVRVDSENKVLTLLSIPRDTPIVFEDGHVSKINTAYRDGGASGSIKAVKALTGVSIAHYAELRMSDFEALIDDLGGIEIEVPTEISIKDYLTGERIELQPGLQRINGQQAQALSRIRRVYEDGDVSRQGMNRQIIMAIIDNILSRPPQEIPAAALSVASHIDTDMTTLMILPILSSFAADRDNITIYSATGPTAGDYREDLGGDWYCYENPEGWKLVVEAMDAGEDPSTIDSNAYAILPEGSETEAATE